MSILFLNCLFNVTNLILILLSFPEHPSSAVRCCTLFRGSLASVYSPSVIISPLQASPHMAAQSQCTRGTRCAWVYESLGKVWQSLHFSSGSHVQWTGLKFQFSHDSVTHNTRIVCYHCCYTMFYSRYDRLNWQWKKYQLELECSQKRYCFVYSF